LEKNHTLKRYIDKSNKNRGERHECDSNKNPKPVIEMDRNV